VTFWVMVPSAQPTELSSRISKAAHSGCLSMGWSSRDG